MDEMVKAMGHKKKREQLLRRMVGNGGMLVMERAPGISIQHATCFFAPLLLLSPPPPPPPSSSSPSFISFDSNCLVFEYIPIDWAQTLLLVVDTGELFIIPPADSIKSLLIFSSNSNKSIESPTAAITFPITFPTAFPITFPTTFLDCNTDTDTHRHRHTQAYPSLCLNWLWLFRTWLDSVLLPGQHLNSDWIRHSVVLQLGHNWAIPILFPIAAPFLSIWTLRLLQTFIHCCCCCCCCCCCGGGLLVFLSYFFLYASVCWIEDLLRWRWKWFSCRLGRFWEHLNWRNSTIRFVWIHKNRIQWRAGASGLSASFAYA